MVGARIRPWQSMFFCQGHFFDAHGHVKKLAASDAGRAQETIGNDGEKGGDRMFHALFLLALVWVVWKLFILGIKMTWGIVKLVCAVFLLPLFLLGLLFAGLLYVALPVLLIVGVGALLSGGAKA